jgi:hypothetical protein
MSHKIPYFSLEFGVGQEILVSETNNFLLTIIAQLKYDRPSHSALPLRKMSTQVHNSVVSQNSI